MIIITKTLCFILANLYSPIHLNKLIPLINILFHFTMLEVSDSYYNGSHLCPAFFLLILRTRPSDIDLWYSHLTECWTTKGP